MDKEKLYQQINKFNSKYTDPSDKGSKSFSDAYLYVNEDEAIDKAEFIKELIAKGYLSDNYEKILDLTFGSGNLTSHIVFDNDIKYEHITLNDINKRKTNQNLDSYIENCIYTENDILDNRVLKSIEADLIIINPQIGGNYTNGNILSQKKDTEKNEDVLDNLYYTLKKFFDYGSTIIFYGKDKDYDSLLDGYNFYKYMSDSKQNLFVINKDIKENICFQREEDIFIINENCSDETETEEEIESFDDLALITEEFKSKENNQVVDNEESFSEWWFNSTYNSTDGIPFADSTKKGYFRAVNQLNTDLDSFGFENIAIFTINNLDFINNLLERLERTDLVEYNKRHQNSDTSNGLKQYIKFLIETNNFKYDSLDDKVETMKEIKEKFSDKRIGKLDFEYKNILFKGVPGTGKSRAIDTIIEKKLDIKNEKKNILRINIHSASSNSDLMQGIGISTSSNGTIKYSEKQGLILDIIKRATFNPNQSFVLILEEIQENSLNELVGDLIYLIEDDKRAKEIKADNEEYTYKELVDKLISENTDISYIEIPYLVNDSTDYKKMIMPDNLFIFCTSNYRDDKKVIEDNLLRRFEVIEIYPNDKIANEYSRVFFTTLNDSIIEIMGKNHETHPDRFMIGHSIWKDVQNKDLFYKAFSKLITEFKDIREVEFEIFKDIIKKCKIPDDVDINTENLKSYFNLIKDIQEKIKYDFIN